MYSEMTKTIMSLTKTMKIFDCTQYHWRKEILPSSLGEGAKVTNHTNHRPQTLDTDGVNVVEDDLHECDKYMRGERFRSMIVRG